VQSFRARSRVFSFLLMTALSVAVAGCATTATHPDESAKKAAVRPTIVFMTDFGVANDAVAICKAVMIGIAPDARIMDITHLVTPYQIGEASRLLEGVTPYYPAGTVFVIVVDPGVGTSRKAIIVKTKKGQYFVVPDNGLMTPIVDKDGLEGAHEITNPAWMIGDKISSTFHGRDIFSPTAAHLAMGEDWTQAGPAVNELVRLNPPTATLDAKGIAGEVIGLDDPFGSLITDISGDDFKKLGYAIDERVTVKIANKSYTMPYVKTFSGVPVGQPLLYLDSRDRVGFAVNQRDFSKVYKVTPPVSVFVPSSQNNSPGARVRQRNPRTKHRRTRKIS
jgi:S-adenosyl-L-methionine hydrolase (adenosine-forming)